MAFVILIPLAGQCSCTAGIGPQYCGHGTGEVDSSDKHWHAALEHCLSLLESYNSSTADSAVTGRGGVRVTVLAHCQALPYDQVTASIEDLYQMWQTPEQCSNHCLPVLSFTVLFSLKSLQWTQSLVTRSPLSVPSTGNFHRSSDWVIRQCLSVTQDSDLDTTAASESTDSSAWVIGLEHC